MADGKCDYPGCLTGIALNMPETPQQFCPEHLAELTKIMKSLKPEPLRKFWVAVAGGEGRMGEIRETASALQAAITMQFIDEAAHMQRGAVNSDEWDVR